MANKVDEIDMHIRLAITDIHCLPFYCTSIQCAQHDYEINQLLYRISFLVKCIKFNLDKASKLSLKLNVDLDQFNSLVQIQSIAYWADLRNRYIHVALSFPNVKIENIQYFETQMAKP
jgi:hypothetical protein